MALSLRFERKGRVPGTVIPVASVILWLALAALGGDFLHAAYLKYSSLASPAYAMFLVRRGWLWCHLAGGTLGVVLGLVQLITQRWPNVWGVHRWCGRVYFAAMLVAVFGAAGLIATSPAPMSIRVAFSATMLAWLVTAGVGLVKILRRDVQAHRRWLLRAYLVTLAPAVSRPGLATAVGQGIAPSPWLIAWMLWGSWALPLLVYGVAERVCSGHSQRAEARTANVRTDVS